MHETSVIARIVGGLGNQLFIYAAARRLADANGVPLVLDTNFFRSDRRYGRSYRLDRYALGAHRVRHSDTLLPAIVDQRLWRLKRWAGRLGMPPWIDSIIERMPNVFEPTVLDAKIRRPTVFDGYWQDERYFEAIAGTLRREIVPTIDPGERNRRCAAEIRERDWIGIHCRTQHHLQVDGTVRAARGRPVLDRNYYERALAALDFKSRPVQLLLFGDDPRWLLDQLPAGLDATVVDWNRDPGGEVNDLWLMQQCRRLIISNSTLSWWGGWLSEVPNRRVVAPRPQDLEYWVRSAAAWREIDW